jgi:hypothetical protein
VEESRAFLKDKLDFAKVEGTKLAGKLDDRRQRLADEDTELKEHAKEESHKHQAAQDAVWDGFKVKQEKMHAEQALSDQRKEAFQKSMKPFSEVDADGDGKLSTEELRAALADAGADNDVDEMMAGFDADGDGQLDEDEYAALQVKMEEQKKAAEEARAAEETAEEPEAAA